MEWVCLLALAALDLRIHLVSARIQQFDGLILQLPHITVQPQIGLVSVDTFAGDQLRGFEPYCCCFYQHRLRT